MCSRQAASGEPVGCPGGPEPQDAALPLGRAQGRGGCARAEAEPSWMRVGIQVMRLPP